MSWFSRTFLGDADPATAAPAEDASDTPDPKNNFFGNLLGKFAGEGIGALILGIIVAFFSGFIRIVSGKSQEAAGPSAPDAAGASPSPSGANTSTAPLSQTVTRAATAALNHPTATLPETSGPLPTPHAAAVPVPQR